MVYAIQAEQKTLQHNRIWMDREAKANKKIMLILNVDIGKMQENSKSRETKIHR